MGWRALLAKIDSARNHVNRFPMATTKQAGHRNKNTFLAACWASACKHSNKAPTRRVDRFNRPTRAVVDGIE